MASVIERVPADESGMLGLVAVAAAIICLVFMFLDWKKERRKRTQLAYGSYKSIYQSSRQSRRFRESKLFESLRSSASDTSLHQQADSFQVFIDRFHNFTQLTAAIRTAGFDRCQVILGIDFSASNEWQGRKTFSRQCLHSTVQRGLNPYQRVLSTLGAILEPFCEDSQIYAYGFGDSETRDHSVFPLKLDGGPCRGFEEVLKNYTERCRRLILAGPTSFAPIVHTALDIVRTSGSCSLHILVLISDGQMGDDEETVQALVEASGYPLSIIMVGVGDGPWDRMEEYDDLLPMRRFDNFQFVDYHRATCQGSRKNSETVFALHALMEIPDQYYAIRRLGYLKSNKN